MLVDKLMNCYGFPSEEAESFIKSKIVGMAEKDQDALAERIMEERPARFGFPDVAALARYFRQPYARKSTKFFWCVCDACGAEYGYGFNKCPKCFLAGKEPSSYKVRVSDEPPHKGVIRWNMEAFSPVHGEKLCVSCPVRDNNYCWMFGDPNRSCSREEFDNCGCKSCCSEHKKLNARLKTE